MAEESQSLSDLSELGEATGAYESVHSEDPAMFEADSLKQFESLVLRGIQVM